jgi:hypothetical protein
MKTPDVIATDFRDVALLEAQTYAAACWLSSRCDATLENAHDQIRVNASEEDQLIKELKAAGFQVIRLRT